MSSITSPVKSDLDPVWEGFHFLKESFNSLTQVQQGKKIGKVKLVRN